MNTPAKLATFGVVLGTVFGAAFGVGAVVGPVSAAGGASPGADAPNMAGMAGMSPGATTQGLAVSSDGYTLEPATTILPAGRTSTFNFRILGPGGRPLTRYTPERERDLHFIVVRRDLTGYQHLHPTRAVDGTWSVPLDLPTPGAYKAFADFQPAGASMAMTLAVDLSVPGDFLPSALPDPSATATVDGYQVSLSGRLVAGQASGLTFSFAQDGKPVTDLQPYLGAYGHLVALRTGDLAYLHVHPDGAPGSGNITGGPAVAFRAEVSTPGAYRLFLDFRHGGIVHTAEFTAVASQEAK